MSDLIDRQAAIDVFEILADKMSDAGKTVMAQAVAVLKDLQSEEPERIIKIGQRSGKTLESAIDYLHSVGWLQEHDRILTESVIKPERKWIPVTEKLPEDKTWYLGIFKESDTGYCISVPFVCYYVGRKTMVTTKDYWILREYQDIYSFSEYYRNLECAAWMPLPEPYRGE